MATPDDLTLSHLVPTSHGLQPRPAPYVSASSLDGRLGIEIGFHRSTPTQGTRGLTSTDGLELIATVRLPEELESATGPLQPLAHITLSFCFDTGQQRVQVQAGDLSDQYPTTNETILCYPQGHKRPSVIRGRRNCIYGVNATICIDGYTLQLVWVPPRPSEKSSYQQEEYDILKARAIHGRLERAKQTGMETSQLVRRSKLPASAYFNNIRVAFDDATMKKFTQGADGTDIFRVLDTASNEIIVVKRLRVAGSQNSSNVALRQLHQEVDACTRLEGHEHIVKYLGYDRADTDEPRIFLKSYDGDLTDLKDTGIIKQYDIYSRLEFHMLSALDFLDYHKICHRDVKPRNILYTYSEQQGYQFALADFGLSKMALTGNTEVGTTLYKAPELYDGAMNDPKMDIWSLLVTFMEVHPTSMLPDDLHTTNTHAIQKAVVQFGRDHERYITMAQVDPRERTTARDMLIRFFEGKGIHLRRSPRKHPERPIRW